MKASLGLTIVHQSSRRLRVRLARAATIDFDALRGQLERLPGIEVDVDALRGTVLVRDDGMASTRAAVLTVLAAAPSRGKSRRRTAPPPSTTALTAGLALALTPTLPPAGQAGLALATLALRALRHPPGNGEEWRRLLARGAQSLGGHPLAALSGLGLQALAEHWGQLQEAQAARLLLDLEPDPSSPSRVRDGRSWRTVRADALTIGQRIQLTVGATVPTDVQLLSGQLRVLPPWHAAGDEAVTEIRSGGEIAAGSTIAAGSGIASVRTHYAESSASHVRDQIAHLLRARRGGRDPAQDGPLSLAVSAMVLGFTGDLARAGALLETDIDAGLSLAAPLARDSAAWALARTGAVLADLDGLDRLGRADTLVIEDLGLVTAAHWCLDASGFSGDRRQIRALLAALSEADTPQRWHDRLVESLWQRGAVVELDGEWILRADSAASRRGRRVFRVRHDGVDAGRLVVELDPRTGLAATLARARAAGFERIIRIAHPEAPVDVAGFDSCIPARRSAVREALEKLAEGGATLAVFAPTWRAQVPPGAVTLAPVAADAPAHFLLLGDPGPALIGARELAREMRRREQRRTRYASIANAALLSASALRWLPPEASSVLHQAVALACMIDALALRRLTADANFPGDFP
jgi:hypothetical protein